MFMGVLGTHSVHPRLSVGGGGVEPPTKFSKRGDLTGSQFLEGDSWKSGSDFFQGGLLFLHKK